MGQKIEEKRCALLFPSNQAEYHVSPLNPRLLPFILRLSLSLSLLPSPASSLHFSFFISPGLSVPGQKDPATVFKDRAPGREVDVVAKVMTTAIRSTHKHKCIQMAHTRIYIHKHVHLCCQHFRPCMRLSDMLFEDIGEAVWATCFTPGAASNEIPARRLQV